MSKTLRIFGKDVVFKRYYMTYTATIDYRNRGVILQFETRKNKEAIFINERHFSVTPTAEVFEQLLPQVIDEVIGSCMGVDFCVKRDDDGWYYYADTGCSWEIESARYDNRIEPSGAHWANWIVTSIKWNNQQ